MKITKIQILNTYLILSFMIFTEDSYLHIRSTMISEKRQKNIFFIRTLKFKGNLPLLLMLVIFQLSISNNNKHSP